MLNQTKPTSNRNQNGLAQLGLTLVSTGVNQFKEAQNGTQVVIGVGTGVVGAAMWGIGKVLGAVGPHIRRGSLAVAKNAAEKGWISQKTVAPVAQGLAAGATLLVTPTVVSVADDVAESISEILT